MKPKILFPFSPGSNKIDIFFEEEEKTAKEAGFETGLVSTELNFGGEVNLKNVQTGNHLLYRGWILKDAIYSSLDAFLCKMGCFLVQPKSNYIATRDFPTWFKPLRRQNLTPRSHVVPKNEINLEDPVWMDNLKENLSRFGGPMLLKDYVKSRKQDWHEACYIPSVEDVPRVVNKFLEIQDQEFVGGLVFREFVDLVKIGMHPKSKMPLVNEWRQFYLGNQLVYQAPYWSDGANYEGCNKPNSYSNVAEELDMGFITLDVAELTDGSWTIIEVNDGGTAGVPDGGNLNDFYTNLHFKYVPKLWQDKRRGLLK